MKLKMFAGAMLVMGGMFSTAGFAATSFQMSDGTLGGLLGRGSGVDYANIINARDDSGASGVVEVTASAAPARRVPLIGRLLYQRYSSSPRFQSMTNRSPLMSMWFEAIALEVDPDDEINERPEVPEIPIPASVWLFMSALGLLVGWKRRRDGEAIA